MVDFSIKHLKYSPNNIIVYGWSIGSFTASYAGLMFPNVKGIILDAGFDNLDILATRMLGERLYKFLGPHIKHYYELNVVFNALNIIPPLLIVVRKFDEIMCSGSYCSNPGINTVKALVLKEFSSKYPQTPLKISNKFILNNIPNMRNLIWTDKCEDTENEVATLTEKQTIFLLNCIAKISVLSETEHGVLLMTDAVRIFMAIHNN